MNKNHLKLQKGFTQIELLVVIGIVVILTAVGVISGFNSISRGALTSEEDKLVLLLTDARTNALANTNAKPHGLYVSNTEFILFEGNDKDDDPTSWREIERNSSVEILPTDTQVVFDQLSADVGVPVDFVLSLNETSSTVSVNEVGQIEW